MAMPAWVSELGVAAQVVIAVAAIWGEKIRAGLTRPRLHLTPVGGPGDAEPRVLPNGNIVTVRCHRLQVRNHTRYTVANEVQVFISQIESREPSGRIRTTFTGAVPLAWQHEELYPKVRNIGHSTVALVNLLYRHGDTIRLLPMTQQVPINVGDSIRGPLNFWITVMARGLNAESKPMRLEIQWEPHASEAASLFSMIYTESASNLTSREPE